MMEVDRKSSAVWFMDWVIVLRQQRLRALHRQQYRFAIIQYLRFCKQTRQRATIESARQFMRDVEAKRRLGKSQLQFWKDALNWFFRNGRKYTGTGAPPATWGNGRKRDAYATARTEPAMTDVPPPAGSDVGKARWEQALIRELRLRHYQWRTEQTYRGWAWRFAQWLERQSRAVEQATQADVRTFLGDLATRQRVSASTQKQALNALVFLLRPLWMSP